MHQKCLMECLANKTINQLTNIIQNYTFSYTFVFIYYIGVEDRGFASINLRISLFTILKKMKVKGICSFFKHVKGPTDCVCFNKYLLSPQRTSYHQFRGEVPVCHYYIYAFVLFYIFLNLQFLLLPLHAICYFCLSLICFFRTYLSEV